MPRLITGNDVEKQFSADLKSERKEIASYNDGMAICVQAADNGSRDLLGSNLRDEERYADFLETQLNLVKLGLANYLAQLLEM